MLYNFFIFVLGHPINHPEQHFLAFVLLLLLLIFVFQLLLFVVVLVVVVVLWLPARKKNTRGDGSKSWGKKHQTRVGSYLQPQIYIGMP